MNTLQTFMLAFELSGDEVVLKGIEKIDKATEELDDKLKDTADDVDNLEDSMKKGAQQTDKSSQNFKKMARQVTAALVPLAALGLVFNQTLKFAKQGEDLLFLANSAGIAANQFQKLALASEMYGGNRQGAAGTMSNLTRQIQALRRGEDTPLSNAAIYYGLDLTNAKDEIANPEEMLENIAKRMESLTLPEQVDLAAMIGLDEGTFRLVQLGLDGYKKALQEANSRRLFSDADLARIAEFQKIWRGLKQDFAQAGAGLAMEFLPYVKVLLKELSNLSGWIKDNKKDITEWVETFAVGLYFIYDVAKKTLGFVIDLLKEMIGDYGYLFGKIAGIFGLGKEDKDMASSLSKANEDAQKRFDDLQRAKSIMSAADNNPLASVGKGDISNTYNNAADNKKIAIVNNINVSGAGDPAATADLIKERLTPFTLGNLNTSGVKA